MKRILVFISCILLLPAICYSQAEQPSARYYVSAYQLGDTDRYAHSTRGVVYRPVEMYKYYPSFAMRSDETGVVELLLTVNDSGDVSNTSVIQGSAFPRLDRAAVEIAKRFRFEPLDKKSSLSSNTKFFVNFGKVDASSPTKILTPEEVSQDSKPYKSKVVARVVINQAGFVESVAILESSGDAKLDAQAIQQASRYEFKPYIHDGKPQRLATNLVIKFY